MICDAPAPANLSPACRQLVASLQVEKGMRDTATEAFTVLDRIGWVLGGDEGGAAQVPSVEARHGRSCCWQCCLLARWGIPPSFKLEEALRPPAHFRYIFLFMLKTVAGCIIWFCALVRRPVCLQSDRGILRSTGGSRCFPPARCLPLGTIRGLVAREAMAAVDKGIVVLLCRMPWSGRRRTRPKAEKVTLPRH